MPPTKGQDLKPPLSLPASWLAAVLLGEGVPDVLVELVVPLEREEDVEGVPADDVAALLVVVVTAPVVVVELAAGEPEEVGGGTD
ncbi:hypothetical protein HK104_000255 [Borealophlyctis nickersoniae]|nr:hypothetical protein HK104_000255 [Borealophlyctis nickersoniae]